MTMRVVSCGKVQSVGDIYYQNNSLSKVVNETSPVFNL